jgi:hypothetical protein
MHQNNLKTATSHDFFFCSLSALCLSIATIVLDISNFVIGLGKVSNDSVYHNVSFVLTGCSDFIAQFILVRILFTVILFITVAGFSGGNTRVVIIVPSFLAVEICQPIFVRQLIVLWLAT